MKCDGRSRRWRGMLHIAQTRRSVGNPEKTSRTGHGQRRRLDFFWWEGLGLVIVKVRYVLVISVPYALITVASLLRVLDELLIVLDSRGDVSSFITFFSTSRENELYHYPPCARPVLSSALKVTDARGCWRRISESGCFQKQISSDSESYLSLSHN